MEVIWDVHYAQIAAEQGDSGWGHWQSPQGDAVKDEMQ